MLCSVVRRRLSSIPNPYERLARRITAEASKSLNCALSLIRCCRRFSVLHHMVSITTGSVDFRKALALLEASLGDLHWLLSVYSSDDLSDGGGVGSLVFSLPPIASIDPILSWVWSCIAAIQMATRCFDRAETATSLANLALDSDRNKKIIIEKGGVPRCSPFSVTVPPQWMPRSSPPLPSPTLPPTASWSPSSSSTLRSPSSSRSSMMPR